jgi:hypothetical protein
MKDRIPDPRGVHIDTRKRNSKQRPFHIALCISSYLTLDQIRGRRVRSITIISRDVVSSDKASGEMIGCLETVNKHQSQVRVR